MGMMRIFILLAAMTAMFTGIGWLIAGPLGMAVAFAIAAALNLFTYWNSDKVVLKMQGAREITSDDRSPVYSTFAKDVVRLAERAGLPPPRVYIIETPQPNAFATGRSPKHAAVAATTGLLGTLTREETAGVMAHELAHVKNRDTLTMTITATLAGAIGMMASLALIFGRRSSGGLVTSLLVMIFAPMAAGLVQMAISRSREYEADKMGARICGNPLWLASALEKIERGARASVNQRAERNPAFAHMYIIHPLAGRRGDKLFSTHPATANRVAALRKMASEDVEADATSNEAGDEPLREAHAAGPWG